ncbi:imidazoleglycerol-phosphate dehydratase 1, chloroplastic isoform X6 [Diospyros lotus]|uniref:imidazoleglycerol-phosphate dehydratase 1, chloroplastic isoform X6 n=1 Tax=Diospyros lotus TaxID=55363 RepID=UPI00225AEA30|nr:imidazoleglycerol-phosphate dehydratase 1, chloroplastic isoform X6 [Diospyros lotus]
MALSISSHPLTSPSSSSTSYSQLPKSTVPRETLIALRFQRRSPLSFGHLRHSLGPMNSQRTTCHASPTTSPPANIGRVGEVKRVTKETDVSVRINLDGSGEADSSTGIPFLDHMLDQLASHGLFDVHVKATGDTHIDDHHTNEDVALAIGTALLQALGDRRGINRFGDFSAPLDEALIHVSLDLSGRPHLSYGLQIPTQRVGTYDTQLVEHFFQSLVNTSGMTLHIRQKQLAGKNSHHIIEATFKAFARALRQATEYDPRRLGTVPSSKGILSRT